MALEDLIRLHTEALAQNTEAVKALTASLAGRTPAKTEAVKDEKPAKKESPAKAEKAAKEDAAPSGKAAEEEVIEEQFVCTPYEKVRELVLKLAASGGREAIKAVNAKHDIASLPSLLDDKEDYKTVNDQEKLEAVYKDLLALEV